MSTAQNAAASAQPWSTQRQQRPPFVIPWSDEERRIVGLSRDGWVELREPEDVTEAGRRMFKIATLRAQDPKATSVERSTALAQTDDYMIAMFVRSWSFGDPIPQAGIERLAELPGRDFDLLVHCCGELVADAFPSFEPTIDENSPFLEAGATEVGSGGRDDRPNEALAARVAAVPVGDADGVDA